MERYQKSNPSNARIFIDYRNKKRPVRFEYPAKKSAFRICFNTFLMAWGLLNVFLIVMVIVLPSLSVRIVDFILPKVYYPFFVQVTFPLSFSIVHFFLPPLVLATIFANNKRLLNLMPEINRFLSIFPLGRHYYKKIRKIKRRKFTIPYFSNTFLDCKATRDFSRFLTNVEIKEHDYKLMKRNWFSNKRRIKNQDGMWYATFFFSRIPKNGQLEIWFD